MSYFGDLAYETDVWLSVLTGGTRDTTVSLRVAKACQAGGHTACLLCAWLSISVEKNHCQNVLADTTTKPGGVVRATLQFAIALLVIWAAVHFGIVDLMRKVF